MSIDDPQELEGLRRAGAVVAATLRDVGARVRPGVTTAELDAAAERVFEAHGARSGPRLDYDSPARSASASTPRPCTASPARGRCARASSSSST